MKLIRTLKTMAVLGRCLEKKCPRSHFKKGLAGKHTRLFPGVPGEDRLPLHNGNASLYLLIKANLGEQDSCCMPCAFAGPDQQQYRLTKGINAFLKMERIFTRMLPGLDDFGSGERLNRLCLHSQD